MSTPSAEIPALAADCMFCGMQQAPKSLYDAQHFLPGKHLFMVPALGMLMAGNFLVATTAHHTSLAQMGADRLTAEKPHIDALLDYLGERFGPYVVVEHGSDNVLEQ